MADLTDFTVTVQSRLPRRGLDYDPDRHVYNEGYFRLPYAIELVAKAPRKTIILNFDDFPGKPGEGPLKPGVAIETLDLPADARAYHWQIARPDGTVVAETTTEIVRQGSRVIRGTPNQWSTTLEEPGQYEISLTLERDRGSPSNVREWTLRDLLVVSIGDSYASGQGNPDTPGKPAGFDPDIGFFDFLNPIGLLLELTDEAVDWGWDRTKELFTTLSLGAEAEIDMDPEPVWFEPKAYRSLRAGPAGAARLIGQQKGSEGVAITFVSFARTGSTVRGGLLGPRPNKDDWIGRVGQVEEMRRTLGDRPIDALLVSIGGNDAGFADHLSGLVSGDFKPLFNIGNDDDLRREVRSRVASSLDDLRFEDLPALAEALSQFEIGQVYLTEYPEAQFERAPGRIGEGCGVFHSQFFDADITRKDAELFQWAARRLNSRLQAFAERPENAWAFVEGVAAGFAGQGYCSDPGMFRSAEGSLVTQGDFLGTMHPNERGQAVYARAIAEAVIRHSVDGEPVPVAPAGPSLRFVEGRPTMLRINEVGSGFGAPENHLDAEVIVALDGLPRVYGFQFRPDLEEDVREGMLDLLRVAFNQERTVRLDYEVPTGTLPERERHTTAHRVMLVD
ncbi:MAG: hypothetical protein GVY32_11160 [Gammaproteobacteria bacterium]|jgi:hypothetical protein|nr:hypothetical protein [Gammaproteobacteria bacterium]